MEMIRGKLEKAKKIVLYGPEGIGKSTFASGFPGAVFCDVEGSTNEMDVVRTPKPSSWTMLKEMVQEFIRHPEQLGTFVLDTADWAERMCVKHICDYNKQTSVESFGYGKGYIYVYEEFGRLLNLLGELTEKGVHVVVTAHATLRKFEQPDEMGSYDRYELKLTKKTGAEVGAMLKEWSDMLLFANYKTLVVNVDGNGALKGKNKAQGGKRVMYTTHTPSWDAKNRYGLPDELPFDYGQIGHIIGTERWSRLAGGQSEPQAPAGGGTMGTEAGTATVTAPAAMQATSRTVMTGNVPEASPTLTQMANANSPSAAPAAPKANPMPEAAPDAYDELNGDALTGDDALSAMSKASAAKPEVQDKGERSEPRPEDSAECAPQGRSPRPAGGRAAETLPSSLPKALYDLMARDGITEPEIMFAVASKGYYPGDMPISNYKPDFVQGVLIGAWPKVRGTVLENREKVPF